jgi:hypothetical protein
LAIEPRQDALRVPSSRVERVRGALALDRCAIFSFFLEPRPLALNSLAKANIFQNI